MGIKYLNRVLRSRCSEAIKQIPLWNLKNKKIAIDTSIYLYRFKGEDALIENFYLMVSLFRFYKITPLFVFDGKPPQEKYEEIKHRNQMKIEAENRYNILENKLEETNNDDERQELISKMQEEKKNFVRITREDIESVQKLLDAYGIVYITANGEADELCYKLTKKKMVYGCLSEDMDLFVYGCERVFRYLSLLNNTLVEYDMKKILNILGVTQTEFREICVLAGTDYNEGCDNIYKALSLFEKYKKTNTCVDFYKWLQKGNLIEDYQKLISTYLMFDQFPIQLETEVKKLQITNKRIQRGELREILVNDGFIFVN
jgi:flap endonuclease-1